MDARLSLQSEKEYPMKVIRSPWFGPAVLLLGIAGMFTFDNSGLAWFWAGQPQGALILLVASAGVWVLLLRNVRKRRNAL